ncbi:MAG TPA: LLM class F420-dependent oxidoreductase [Jiangellaceae bacterium]|nr:LLM class F420-dependent oxidoreductase [Jiangellaceae bacterium]
MQLRIFTEPQEGATYDQLRRVAMATEDLGFDAFFRSDHYLAMDTDGLPGPTDAWVTIAGLARETTRIRLGTLVSPVTFRLPGPLAISVAQVDAMSGGRVELGIGAGWYEAEHTAYGMPFPPIGDRFDLLEEQLAVITGLWQSAPGERFSFAGVRYTLADSPALPKPLQRPRPPVILGGKGRTRTPRLAARYADEHNVGFSSVDRTGEAFERVRAACAEAGRDEHSMVYSVAQTVCCGADESEVLRRARAIGRDADDLRRTGLGGTPDEIVDRIGQFSELGASRVYLQVLDLDDLDHLALLSDRVLGQVG